MFEAGSRCVGAGRVACAHDGITFTAWRDEAAAVAFAYRPGAHKTEMGRFRLDETADGTWYGGDPLAANTELEPDQLAANTFILADP